MKVSLVIIKLPSFIENFFPMINSRDYQRERKLVFAEDHKLACFFDPRERAAINGFHTYKRQIEWICGRLAIKHLVEMATDYRYAGDTVFVAHKPGGAPYLEIFPDWGVSISHSHEYAIGAICPAGNTRLGIDIEKINGPLADEFMNVAFTCREIRSLQHKPPEQVYTSWTIKEAFLKYIAMGFHENLQKVEVINNRIYHNNMQIRDITVKSYKLAGNYTWSLVTAKTGQTFIPETSCLKPSMLEKSSCMAVA